MSKSSKAKEYEEIGVEKVNKYDGKRVLVATTTDEVVDFIEEKTNNVTWGLKRGAFRKKLKRNIKTYNKTLKTVTVVMINNYHFMVTINGDIIIDVQTARTTAKNPSVYWKSIDNSAQNKVDLIDKHVIDHSEYEEDEAAETTEETEETNEEEAATEETEAVEEGE